MEEIIGRVQLRRIQQIVDNTIGAAGRPHSQRGARAKNFRDQLSPPSMAFFASSTAYSAVSASAEVVASSSTEGGIATRIFLPFNRRMFARHRSVSRWNASMA